MERFEKIYNDTDKILGNPIYALGGLAGRSKTISDEGLTKLKEYSEKFLNCEDRGELRTILIVLKPYRNNEITKQICDKLSAKLRESSNSGII